MKKKGFTLIELLAVIVILAIILAITIPGISGVIKNSTKAAFESDAKMVLKAIDYEKLSNRDFDATIITKENLTSTLGIGSENYTTVSVAVEDNVTSVTIVGTGKWDGLVACGSYRNMKVVNSIIDCSADLVQPVITVLGSNPINIFAGDTYTDAGATATDDKDGDITSNITTTGSVNANVIGVYTITYSVTDTALNTATNTRTVNVLDKANAPVLATGMTPIKWDGSAWITTTADDTDWYSYTTTNKKWANARTTDGSIWVWIPRYAYQIASNYHTDTTGTINIKFLQNGTNNTNDGTVVSATPTYSGSSQTNYIANPAFTFGATELTGIWVAKFEASGTTSAVDIVPSVSSLRMLTIGDMFTASRNMETNSRYGWGTTGTGLDTHLMKNIEWGATVYLAQSTYGKNAAIWINPSSDYITGCAGTGPSVGSSAGCSNYFNSTNGVQASTTGNVYGIYDMSGGAWEYVAGYVNNGDAVLSTTGSIILSADSKYKDVYAKGTTDDSMYNFMSAVDKVGDAVYETAVGFSSQTSWYSSYSAMPYSNYPWFKRGGINDHGVNANSFVFVYADGYDQTYSGFRPTLVVGAGL